MHPTSSPDDSDDQPTTKKRSKMSWAAAIAVVVAAYLVIYLSGYVAQWAYNVAKPWSGPLLAGAGVIVGVALFRLQIAMAGLDMVSIAWP